MELRRLRFAVIAFICSFMVLGAILSLASGQTKTAKEKASSSALAGIGPFTAEEPEKTYSKLLEERIHRVDEMLQVVDKLGGSAKTGIETIRLYYAIRMLGEIRAAEAAQPLLDIMDIDLPKRVTWTSVALPPEDPVIVQVLAQIGKPSSTRAVEYLAKDKSAKRALMYVRVIVLVEGMDLGKVMVNLAADKEKDPEKKARLQAAIALFDKADKPIP
jgi:hypothetical protein